MISLYTQTPQFFNDICDEIRLFFPVRKINKAETDDLIKTDEYFIAHYYTRDAEACVSDAVLYCGAQKVGEFRETTVIPENQPYLEVKKQTKRLVKNCVYNCLKNYTGKKLPWGSLTGIRPTKLARELSRASGRQDAIKLFGNTFDVSEEKTELAFGILDRQIPVLNSIDDNDIDIYINIPFCVSRCKYCSFITQDFKRADKFRAPYLEALKREVEAFKPFLEQKNIRAVYIGGGTPTALNESEFFKLLQICKDLGQFKEFTVEAGRPDTINGEKLAMMSEHKVSRLSINPQTLNQSTLDYIERRHTAEQFYRAFGAAQKYGFKSINTDIILGLPGETALDMERTIKGILNLKPQNITVHTLALKRSSAFSALDSAHFCDSEVLEDLIERTRENLSDFGYFPYYLYRQKYMNGNLENTGFCRDGAECMYNIDNMEEAASILAFGAGSISKRLFDREQRIERQANVKDVELYIKNIDDMTARKLKLFC